MIKRLAITSGEPAGIGPDLCLSLDSPTDYQLVVLGNRQLFDERAVSLGKTYQWPDYQSDSTQPGIYLLDVPTAKPVVAGKLNPNNGDYVLDLLDRAIEGCQQGEFAAMVTGPVHKAVIHEGAKNGQGFLGHTEYLQEAASVERVVMMLASPNLKVALTTTHLPLSQVSAAITKPLLTEVIEVLINDLTHKFGIPHPRVLVAGLNPHAGEDGLLGREEIEVIRPVINELTSNDYSLLGPLPADTLFTPKYLENADAVLAMYHDQGLPVLKFQGFGDSANITLGLPFIRTSVDHGTALDLAGTGLAENGGLLTAIDYALLMASKQS